MHKNITRDTAKVTLIAIATLMVYVGVMALTSKVSGKPMFAIACTNEFAATFVIIWRERNKNTIGAIKRKRLSMYEYVGIPVIIVITNMSTTLIALWVKQTLNYPSPVQQLTQTTSIATIIAMSLTIVPIGEEALMRGFLYPLLRTRFSAPLTIVITACVFALLHGNPVQMVLTLPLGIVLGYLYEQTHDLRLCIGAHMLFNALTVVLPSGAIGTWNVGVAFLLMTTVLTLWMNPSVNKR